MSKHIFIILVLNLSVTFCYSQDIITLKTNDEISVKLIEVTPSEIKYKKMDNLNGPTFTILKSDIVKVHYENGTEDIFNKNVVTLDEAILKTSRENPLELLMKGNKVFIEIPDEASRAGEKYFIDALKEWGYWDIVKDESEAHFIVVFNIDKKAMLDKSAFVTFKTREKKEFLKSDSYRSSTSAFNGYNAFKAVAIKIVDKYFKQEFK
jgi:hypothetical protein